MGPQEAPPHNAEISVSMETTKTELGHMLRNKNKIQILQTIGEGGDEKQVINLMWQEL